MDENSLEIDLSTVKSRAVKGIMTLTGRTAIMQLISFFGFFFLTVFLGRGEIGLVFAVSEIVSILGYFSDVGLAAALIQKKEKPETEDVKSTFTIQQILVVTLCIIVLALTPWIRNFYNIDASGIWLLWALVAGFFLSSLKTIPSVLLERQLKFDRLVLVEIAENLFFYGIAVLLAWRGFGVIAYAWAVLVRGLVGVILIYLLNPWQIGFALKIESLKELLKFGLPYQGNTFLAVIKDRLMNVVLWKIIGAEGVGILGWAQKWAQMPLRFTMDAAMKVSFPAYSRMQEDKEELKKAVEKTLHFISLLTFPILAGIAIIAQPLVNLIPQYEKWNVALIALYLYIFNAAFGAITTPLTNALSAVGKIRVVFKLMIMWTALTWIFFPILAIRFGYNGVALASALVSTSSVVAIIVAKRSIDFSFWNPVRIPLLATVAMSLISYLLSQVLAPSVISLAAIIFISCIVYLGFLLLTLRQQFLADISRIVVIFKK